MAIIIKIKNKKRALLEERVSLNNLTNKINQPTYFNLNRKSLKVLKELFHSNSIPCLIYNVKIQNV